MGGSKLSYAEMLKIKKGAQSSLFSIPGVIGVGFGAKVSDGRPIGEFAIIVYVVKKRPKSELPPEEVIPAEIDGVKTDVVVGPKEIVRHAALQGGDDLVMSRSIPGGQSEGTLGCLARTAAVADSAPPDILLSCHHVLFSLDDDEHEEGQVGDEVTIPSCCGICHPTVAKVLASPPIDEYLDVAIAGLEPGQKSVAQIHGLPVTGILDLTDTANLPLAVQDALRFQTYQVFQCGAKSGITKGRIADANFDTQLATLPNKDQIKIIPIGRDDFTVEGDSGSVLYNQAHQILGINWGGENPKTHNPPHATFACQIQRALNGFQNTPAGVIRIATNPPVVVYTVPGIRRPPPILERIHRDLAQTGHASHYIQLYGKHQTEVSWLGKHCEPLISAWHKNDGTAMGKLLIGLIDGKLNTLPTQVGERSWAECVRRIGGALLQYGSEPLRLDVLRYARFVSSMGGYSYQEMLQLLRAVATTEG